VQPVIKRSERLKKLVTFFIYFASKGEKMKASSFLVVFLVISSFLLLTKKDDID